MSSLYWPAPLSALPPAARAALAGRLPACDPDCTDGERLYRCLAAWAVPWRRVPKTLFWRNWRALDAERRRQLLAEGGAYAHELREDAHWIGAALRRDDAGTLAAALQLGAGTLPDLPPEYRSTSYLLPCMNEYEDRVTPITRAAAFHGATRCILYLVRVNYEKIQKGGYRTALDYLALEGRLRCLRAVHRKSRPPISWDISCTGAAARCGSLPCLRYLHEQGCPWCEVACADAAGGGHLPCLQYLHEQGCPWDEGACVCAAGGGHLSCLQYLHQQGCPWSAWACSWAALSGQLPCLRYLYELDYLWSERSCEWACEWAAMYGQLPCLQYLHEQGCPWSKKACNQAAGKGHLPCLQYLHEQGCPWDEGACVCAAGGGHLSCLQYLHEQGCPWSERTCTKAAGGGHLPCLQYLHEQGCPWSAKTRAAAAEAPACLQYLAENGCPEA